MKCCDYWWYLKGITTVFEERGRILISDFWSINCIVFLSRMIETQQSIPCLWVHVLYVTRHRVPAHMILRLQISFPLPKAYNSIPSNCGVLHVPSEYHLDWAERGLHHELTLERGGEKTTPPYLIVTKKHWNEAGIWLQWWFMALVTGRGFRWCLMQSWWQKENVCGEHRGFIIIVYVQRWHMWEMVHSCKFCQFKKVSQYFPLM